MALFRFMVVDEDGQRVGRLESEDRNWRAGDAFMLEEQRWRVVEILPEVSTMIAYNAVWIAAPVAEGDDDLPEADWPMPVGIQRAQPERVA